MKEKSKNLTMSDRISLGIDKVVGIFSPEKAYKRMAFRHAHKTLLSAAYKSARTHRLNDSWLKSSGSADDDLLPDLATLRERSRDLTRNNPYGSGIINTVDINTISTGIRPQSRLRGENLKISHDEAMRYQSKFENIWQKWSPFADAGERMNIYELQSLIDRQILVNGEIFVLPLMISQVNRPYKLALDLVEADRVDTPTGLRSDRSIRSGIKLGERGQPIEYYVMVNHPGDVFYRSTSSINKWKTYKPRDPKTGRPQVLHLYPIERVGQSRGVPFFTPVIDRFQHLDEYLDAELIAARVAACFSIFIESVDVQSAYLNDPGSTVNSKKAFKVSPGLVRYLNPGEKISSFNPNRPSQSFDSFILQILRMISASLNLPYELVAKDFTKSNYSNTRAALLQAYRYFRYRQFWLSQRFCQPIYEILIEEAYLRGEIDIPNFYKNKEEWLRTKWLSDGWEWVDPAKDVKAANESLESGIETLADVCAARGKDWEETLEQRAREKKREKDLEDELGIKFSSSKKEKIPAGLVEKDDDEDDEGDEKG